MRRSAIELYGVAWSESKELHSGDKPDEWDHCSFNSLLTNLEATKVSEQIVQKSLSARLQELIEAKQSGQPAAVTNNAPLQYRNATTEPSDFAWVRTLREGHEGWFRAEFWTRLEAMPAGPRIRHLRRVFGWTQKRAADELGVSVRTVIRHEQGQRHRPWANSAWLWRLSKLERDHESQLFACFPRVQS